MEDSIISVARKSCNMCYARRGLRSTEKEKETARTALNDLYHFYIDKFNAVRATDAPAAFAVKARENKTLCLNLLDECNSCDRMIDKINQGLKGMSK